MPRINGRWLAPVVVCALFVACAAEDHGTVADATPSGGRAGSAGSSAGGGSGGSGGAAIAGAAGHVAAGTGGVAGTTAGAGTAGSGGTSAAAGADSTPGASAGNGAGGAGGEQSQGGGAGEPNQGGEAGSVGSGGAGGAPSCDDGVQNGSESHVDCGDSENHCGDCAFPLTRYIIGSGGSMGSVTMTWDATNLYFVFAVTDDTPHDDSALQWQDDSVEIYLDVDNAKSTSYQADDQQLTIARSTTEIQGINSADTGSIVVVRASDAGGYTLDVTVPWAAIGVSNPPLGDDIGFDFAINDDRDGGDTREAQVMVFGASNNFENTSQFGTITLN